MVNKHAKEDHGKQHYSSNSGDSFDPFFVNAVVHSEYKTFLWGGYRGINLRNLSISIASAVIFGRRDKKYHIDLEYLLMDGHDRYDFYCPIRDGHRDINKSGQEKL